MIRHALAPMLPTSLALAALLAPIAPAGAQDEKGKDDEKTEAPAEETSDGSAEETDDPEALKERVAELRARVAELELQVAILELEKLGAGIAVEGPDDGPTTARVTLPKLWRGDAEALDRLKALPEVNVVYVDNPEFDDEAAAKLAELKGLEALTIMSPALTGAALEHIKGLPELGMLFLTDTEVGDDGLGHLEGLPKLKELSLSRTAVTDAGLATLAELPELRTLYLIGAEVSDEAVAKFEEANPDVRVVR